MPPRRHALAAPLLAATLAACASARSVTTVAADPAPSPAGGSLAATRVWFTGQSNIRRFTCRARDARSRITWPSGVAARAALAGDSVPVQALLTVPVARLDCGIGQQSKHLREALREREAPEIAFRLAGYAVSAPRRDSVRLDGTLTIAGTARAVTLHAASTTDSTGAVRLTGIYPLRPTDYGVTPPRRFLGMLRVRDAAVVHFDVIVPATP